MTSRSLIVSGLRRIAPTLGALCLVAMGGAALALKVDDRGTLLSGKPDAQKLGEALRKPMDGPIEQITVKGLVALNEDDILALTGLSLGDSMMDVRLKDIHAALVAHPRIRAAEIYRQMAGHLVIRIEERTPLAIWQNRGDLHLVDREGVVIAKWPFDMVPGLKLVVGDGAQNKAASLMDLLAEQPALASRVKAAVWVGERRWDLIFDNDVRLKLPAPANGSSPQDAWAQFARMEAEHALLSRDVSELDLRLADRLVVRVADEKRKDKGSVQRLTRPQPEEDQNLRTVGAGQEQ